MYAYKLAVLALLSATVCALPTVNPNALAAGAPAPNVPAKQQQKDPFPVTETAETNPNAPHARELAKRQIHNADYHAAPPSPNGPAAANAAASDPEPSPARNAASPANSPAAAPAPAAAAAKDAPVGKDKRSDVPTNAKADADSRLFKNAAPGPAMNASGSGSRASSPNAADAQQVDVSNKSLTLETRSDSFASKLVARLYKFAGDWQGLGRTLVEEMSNHSNTRFDHLHKLGYSREEVAKLAEKWRML